MVDAASTLRNTMLAGGFQDRTMAPTVIDIMSIAILGLRCSRNRDHARSAGKTPLEVRVDSTPTRPA
jgi:hypothetical protein